MHHTKIANEIKSKLNCREIFRELYPDNYRAHGNSLCPFHNDTDPSLKLDAANAYCYAEGKSFDIFDLWQAAHGCDFKTAVKELGERAGVNPEPGSSKIRPLGKILKTYDYEDANGNRLYQVVRFEPKDFRVRKPDGEGWTWKMGDTPRVLYRLPDVLAASTVYICEGEKDADNLSALGLCGTTPPQGADERGSKWPGLVKKYRIHEPLKRKRVYVLPDNDKGGSAHALAIAGSLLGFAESVRVLDLKTIWPDIPEKGDVSDFIAYHGPEKAMRLLAELAERPAQCVLDEPTTNHDEGEDDSQGEKKGAASRFHVLMGLLSETDCEFFHDQFQNPWVCVSINGHRENLRVRSRRFTTFLTGLYYRFTRDGVGRETLKQVQDLCAAKGVFEGNERPLSCRSAAADNGDVILIDIGDPDWTSVRVTADGWTIENPERPPFRQFSHMKRLPLPERGGSVQDILGILPIRDETSRILVCTWLPTLFVPDIPRPGIVLAGLQGSGKTFTTERLRELVDPSESLTLNLPTKLVELVQALDHHYLPCFDNIESLPEWASNGLCRAVTGAGFTKRELFSDDDDFCYSFFRPFVLNGISVCASRPDLLDRSLIIELERISPNERRSVKALRAEFQRLRPRIFGAMLDALVYAMSRKDSVELGELPRLADWCQWAVPVAEYIGFGSDPFLEALRRNNERQHTEVTTGEPLAIVLLTFLQDKRVWRGTPSELFTELSSIAEESKLHKEKNWPNAANSMTRKLRTISHNLAAAGIVIRDGKRGQAGVRIIEIERAPHNTPEISSIPSHRQGPSDINTLSGDGIRDGISDDIVKGGEPKKADGIGDDIESVTVTNTVKDNQQTLLRFDGIDDSDDVSGYSAGLEERLQSFGCRDSDCFYFEESESGPTCVFVEPVMDLTRDDARCPRFNHNGTPKAADELPFSLTETL